MKVAIIAETYHCIGNSRVAFDGDGCCLFTDLPWRNIEDFELAMDVVTSMSKREFHSFVPADPFIEAEVDEHNVSYLESDGIFMIHDKNTDSYYFFA